jgi:hypothetical protein
MTYDPNQPQPAQPWQQPGHQPPQYPPPGPPPRKPQKPFWKSTGVLIIVVAALSFIIGIVVGSAGKSTTTTAADLGATVTVTSAPGASPAKATNAATAASSSASAKPAAAHVGSTLILKGDSTSGQLTVTLVAVKDNPPGKDQFSKPSAGNKFYAIQYRLLNTSSIAYSDSPTNGAKVIDGQGQQFQSDFADTTAGPSFPGGTTIPPGGTALGWITFQVPTASVVVGAQFALSSGFGTVGQWAIP